MAPRRRVRRTSSLPGLASDDPTGLSVAPPVVLPPPPSAAPPSYSFTFTTNLTPNTFQHADKSSAPKDKATPGGTTIHSASDLYPPQEGAPSPANSTSSNPRKRPADALDEFYTDALPPRSTPHTRKFSVGHIPRPPNAFILFRSDLVARKAVPTSLEAGQYTFPPATPFHPGAVPDLHPLSPLPTYTDHSTISKIIGVCWRTLPARQRKRWEQKALEAKAAHKKQYPDYRYTPVHRKGPSRKKAKKEQKKDDARVDELAQLLLSGSKGAELEERVKKLDESNPDSYQSTLSFNNGASGSGSGMDSHGQQFTFVQGFPAAGHSIQVPSAPSMYAPYSHHHYNPNQPRRHSSAPPADNAFLDGGASSSTASTPRTTSRDLSLHTNDGADSTSPTDSLVPLSRIARKLPTKSTHHLQPHHFRDEANVIAANAAHASAAANNKKLKSSMSKAVRARAQGFGAPQPASERDQLFIQSHWTNASIDPSSTSGEKKKKNKKRAIPQDMLMPPWDLKEGTTQSGNASPNITSHAVPLPSVPGFISAEHYSPSYAPAYPDEKYQYDGAGVGPFDLLTYQDYGLTGLDMDPLSTGDLNNSAALNAALNGAGALGGFDFADQFGALGVEADANDDYGYSYYAQGADLGSGPASANSSSPHNSDADEAAAYHPYDMPAPLTMAAQDPLGGYQTSQQQHPIVYNTPDWNAFNGTTNTTTAGTSAQPAELDPLDPLSVPPPSSTAGPPTTGGTGAFDHFVYPPLPNSGPPSECGDADEYGDYSQSPIRQTMPMGAPAFSMRQQQQQQQHQPMQLSLNMQYVTPSSAPGSAASYDYSHVHHLDYAHHQAAQYSPAASSATSPVIYHHAHHSAHPQQVQVMMAPPSHHMQQSPHLQQHHPHHALPHSHMHTHSHSHSMESFHELHEPMLQSGGEQPQQWGEWTHPDPFRPQGGDESLSAAGVGAGGFDPLATGNSAIVDAYRG